MTRTTRTQLGVRQRRLGAAESSARGRRERNRRRRYWWRNGGGGTGGGTGGSNSGCVTPQPVANWVCVNGGWVPPDHPLAGSGGGSQPGGGVVRVEPPVAARAALQEGRPADARLSNRPRIGCASMEAGCHRIIPLRAVEDRERRCCRGRSRAICHLLRLRVSSSAALWRTGRVPAAREPAVARTVTVRLRSTLITTSGTEAHALSERLHQRGNRRSHDSAG